MKCNIKIKISVYAHFFLKLFRFKSCHPHQPKKIKKPREIGFLPKLRGFFFFSKIVLSLILSIFRTVLRLLSAVCNTKCNIILWLSFSFFPLHIKSPCMGHIVERCAGFYHLYYNTKSSRFLR